MRKIYIPLSLLLASFLSVHAGTKLDANTTMALNYYRQSIENPGDKLITPISLPFKLDPTSRSIPTVSFYATLAEGYTADDVAKFGFSINTQIGDIVVASGSLDDLLKLSESDCVSEISLSQKVEAKLDVARTATGVSKAHEGTDLPQVYKGTGVIAGIYDQGLDPNHVEFLTEDLTDTRIKRLYYFATNTGNAREYSTFDQIKGFSTDDNTTYHGSHTLGCMAGSFNLSGGTFAQQDSNGKTFGSSRLKNPYYGMAPEADIVAGCGSLVDANITTAVSKIIEYAESQNQPCVINLSLGTNLGLHDETTDFNKTIDELGKRAIICISSGNEGDENISIVKSLTSSDNTLKTFLESSSSNSGRLTIWGSNADMFTLTPVVYNLTTNTYTELYNYAQLAEVDITTNEYTQSSYVHNNTFDNAFTGSYLLITGSYSSNKARYGVTFDYTINYNTTSNASKNLVLGLIITGKNGQRIELTSGGTNKATLSSRGKDGWTAGGNDFSINTMACGKNVIAVGAWDSRYSWYNINTNAMNYSSWGFKENEICTFTSYGVLNDGRSLPVVCAPGAGIISAMSTPNYTNDNLTTSSTAAYYNDSKNNRMSYWGCAQGTSMSCPILAGGVALWLQADPTLTVEDVVKIIRETADKDEYVTSTGNSTQWGAGKFNAYAGLKKVIAGVGGVNSIKADGAEVLVSATGNNSYEVSVPGANSFSVAIYSLAGATVLCRDFNGDTANISLDNLAKGVYVINVNGQHSDKVIVK